MKLFNLKVICQASIRECVQEHRQPVPSIADADPGRSIFKHVC